MRFPIVILSLILVLCQTEPAPGQALPADVGPGRIAWFDLATTDLARSKAFYGQLFGWEFAPVQGTDQAAEIVAGGTHIGTIRGADGALSVFNGVVYVQVTDIQASCKKARELGGTIPPGFPFNPPTALKTSG